MSTKRVLIPADFPLAGLLSEGDIRAGVVLCHPHPLYGGDMENNVVRAMDQGFSAKGFTALRFNFRGVGASGGSYDEGEGEVRDLLAAAAYLKSVLRPDSAVMLAGYSFGAWICARAAARVHGLTGLFLVAYPFSVYDAVELKAFRGSVFLVGGTSDHVCPMDKLLEVYREIPVVDKYLKIMPTDHFYGGKDKELTEFIEETIYLPSQA